MQSHQKCTAERIGMIYFISFAVNFPCLSLPIKACKAGDKTQRQCSEIIPQPSFKIMHNKVQMLLCIIQIIKVQLSFDGLCELFIAFRKLPQKADKTATVNICTCTQMSGYILYIPASCINICHLSTAYKPHAMDISHKSITSASSFSFRYQVYINLCTDTSVNLQVLYICLCFIDQSYVFIMLYTLYRVYRENSTNIHRWIPDIQD